VVTLTGNSSAFAGATTVNAGKTLAIGTGGSLGAAGSTLNLTSTTASVAFTNASGISTIGSTISGAGTLSKSGAGTGELTANNNYTGNNTVSGGTLQIGNGGTTGTLGTGGAVTLSNSANLSYVRSAPTTIANNISGTGNVSASITGAASTLTVSNPINLTGSTTSNVVNLAADNNITVAAAIATTNTSSSAVLLNAGKSTNVGTSTGGNISFSGSGTVTVGSGGRATLMTGSVSGSTGLTALVGAGSGRFRYNSYESTTNYSTATKPLGSGLYGIYREAPVITASVNSVVKTYDGTAYSGGKGVGTFSGLLNGESAQLGTITYTGDSQGAKNARANTYTLNATASSGLGYAVILNPGTLTINKANLTVTASSVTKTYDGTTSATGTGIVGTLAGQAAGESVNNPGIQAFLDKNAGTGNKHVRASGVTIKDSANVDVTDNYSITYTDNTTSNVTPPITDDEEIDWN
jgi:autotransporter-associated beta strand protein